MSLDLDPLHLGALAHPETSSQWYLHLFSKALWCLTDITRLVRCGISSAGQWLYICRCRCHPLVAGCCCRTLGCSLLGCYRSNRWLCCRSRCSLISLLGKQSGDRLSSHFKLGMYVMAWQHLDDIHECGPVLICTQLHQWIWWCRSHDLLHVLQWQGVTVFSHCWLQKQFLLHIVVLSCGNLYSHG